jgi:hypothetical protein
MAVITNTTTTYGIVGKRETLHNVISNVSPEETPFVTGAGSGDPAGNTYFEWLEDALQAASTSNYHLEGDDVASFDAANQPVRRGNYTQISRKTLITSGTSESVPKAGRASEHSYHLVKRGKELRLDIEAMMLANNAAVAGGAGTARETGAVLSWIRTNVDKAGDGVNPAVTTGAPTDARTDGTQRPLTEALLKAALQLGFESGAKFSTLMVGAYNKGVVSAFDGIAAATNHVSGTKVKIVAAADVYMGDFATLTVVPSREIRDRDALLIDWNFVEMAWLREIKKVDLAKTGDAEKSMLIGEYGLRVKNQKGLGGVFDLTTSA